MIGFDRIARRRDFLAGFVVGAIACAVLVSLTGCAARPPDLGAAVATAGPASDGSQVTLHAGRGPCSGDARAAVWSAPGRERVLGCWVLAEGGRLVLVSYLDGDRGEIPPAQLVKVRAS